MFSLPILNLTIFIPDISIQQREEAEQKKLEATRRKAEKDALLAEEEKGLRATPKSSKAAPKKTRGLDLAQLDDPSSSSSSSSKPAALNATGIDNAIDALSLTSANPSEKIDRHPERRFKAAYAAFEARRLPEVEEEHKGLRKNQRIELIRKEFEKHPDNPFNQANARFDSTKDEIASIKEKERTKVELRLAEKWVSSFSVSRRLYMQRLIIFYTSRKRG